MPGSKAIYRNINKLNFRILYLIPYPHHGPGVVYIVCKHCEPLGYMDDTKLFLGFPASELDDVISAVNEDLKEIPISC